VSTTVAAGTADAACTYTYVSELVVNSDAALNALIVAAFAVTGDTYVVTQGDQPSLNGTVASIIFKPSKDGVVLNLSQYWSTQTIKFDSGCEGTLGLAAGANPAAETEYDIGSGNSAAITWAVPVPTAFPAGVATPVCAWIY